MLKFCSMGVHLWCIYGHVTLKFRKISGNISESIQDRHIVINYHGKLGLIGNHKCPIELHQYR